jgi:hypothetical protein
MRAIEGNHRNGTWRKPAGIAAGALLALSLFGGSAQAADSRDFDVIVGSPTPVSQGGATKFDVKVQSNDNQTVANVRLSIPGTGQTWPAGLTITAVFGPNASMCAPSNGTSLSCDFGNISAFGSRSISVIASVASTVPVGETIVFTALAETNNENGSNQQVEPGASTPLHVIAFNADSLTTFNLTGQAATSALGTSGAGNLQTKLNLLQNNGGNGNAIVIAEGTNSTQPAYCVTLKLTCQPDFADVTVNAGATVSPYLETILTANVPKAYNIKKAFVIHVLTNGTVESGFPLFNSSATSCAAHPTLVPCADFSQTQNVLKITVHTATNGKYNY